MLQEEHPIRAVIGVSTTLLPSPLEQETCYRQVESDGDPSVETRATQSSSFSGGGGV